MSIKHEEKIIKMLFGKERIYASWGEVENEIRHLKEQNNHLEKMLALYEAHSERVYKSIMSINKKETK